MKTPTNVFSQIAENYLASCNTIQLSYESQIFSMDEILNTLITIKRRTGLVYEVYTPPTRGMGGECICYARPESLPSLKEYLDAHHMGLHIELPEGYLLLHKAIDWTFTPLGIWEWILIEDVWRNLPLFWHANYAKVDYILDLETYRAVVPDIVEHYLTPTGRPKKGYRKEIEGLVKGNRRINGRSSFDYFGFKSKNDLYSAIELAKTVEKDLSPAAIEVDPNTIEVSYCIWSDWGGLCKIIYHVQPSRRRGQLILTRIKDTALVQYDCGICF